MIVFVLFEWVGDEKIMKGVFRTEAGAKAKRDADRVRWGWGSYVIEEVEVEA
jgi:hypothetical protein